MRPHRFDVSRAAQEVEALAMRERGLMFKDIAAHYGVSKGRAWQLVKSAEYHLAKPDHYPEWHDAAEAPR